jgi:hypothetical protein
MMFHPKSTPLSMITELWPGITWSTEFTGERDAFSVTGEYDGRTETRTVRLTLANSLSDRSLVDDLSCACHEIAETLQPPQPEFLDFTAVGAEHTGWPFA